MDEDEEPGEAAVRELEEQTGYRAGQLEHVVTFQPLAEVATVSGLYSWAGMLSRWAIRSGRRASSGGVGAAGSVRLIAAGQIWNAASLVGLLSIAQRER